MWLTYRFAVCLARSGVILKSEASGVLASWSLFWLTLLLLVVLVLRPEQQATLASVSVDLLSWRIQN